MKIFIFYGLKRSGNHGIISSIIQAHPNSIHINNVRLSIAKFRKFYNIPITKHARSRQYTGFKNADCLIISMENNSPDIVKIKKFQKAFSNHIDTVYPILLLRNPYNNASSIWKIYHNLNVTSQAVKTTFIINTWKLYATEYLNDNSIFIKILYDKFYTDNHYRKNLFKLFNIDNIDNIDFDVKYGPGTSSFKKKQKRKLFWGEMKDSVYYPHPIFSSLFSHDIHELWNKIKNIHKNDSFYYSSS